MWIWLQSPELVNDYTDCIHFIVVSSFLRSYWVLTANWST